MKTAKLLLTLCVFLVTFLVGGIGLADDCVVFDSVSSDSALEAPKLMITGTNISLSWTAVAGATGYNLYYAPFPYTGSDSIKSIPMKTQTSMSGSLSDGDAIYVAVKAHNSYGSSGFSNIKCVNIGNDMPEGGGSCSCSGIMYGTRWCDNLNGTVTPGGHLISPTCGHLFFPHPFRHLAGMKKKRAQYLQELIRHPIPKFDSQVGDFGVATGGGFSSGHPGSNRYDQLPGMVEERILGR